MFIKNDNYIIFDFYLPVYNWFYPLKPKALNEEMKKKIGNTSSDIFNFIGESPKNRSLYFHIPYCQDICSFCPFSRSVLKNSELLDIYVEALIKEIHLKASYDNIRNFPIHAMTFGGGTPSILDPKHIEKIGEAIHSCFDLSQLKEFSFEMNAKTVTLDRVQALKKIGVTHPRIGIQTFNPKYRKLFDLSATLDQVYNGVELLKKNFSHICVDILYGMHGQTVDDLILDLHHAIQLGIPNIDLYPINNTVIQKRLCDSYKKESLEPTTGLSKMIFNTIANEYMRNNGYLPHNGHGYVKCDDSEISRNPIVTNTYTFEYHETVYGYEGHEVIGFGAGAYSSFNGYATYNYNNVKKYTEDLLNNNHLNMEMGEYDKDLCDIKGIALHLPYHGFAKKISPDVKTKYVSEIKKKILILKEYNLISEDAENYYLTQKGWNWYVNLLYFLSPSQEQQDLLDYIKAGSEKEFSSIEKWKIDMKF